MCSESGLDGERLNWKNDPHWLRFWMWQSRIMLVESKSPGFRPGAFFISEAQIYATSQRYAIALSPENTFSLIRERDSHFWEFRRRGVPRTPWEPLCAGMIRVSGQEVTGAEAV